MMFPTEIWERIFLYVDPVTLMHFKRVCKCWNAIIDKVLEENDHWYRMCKKEIPENLWSTLCETLNPKKFYTEFHEKYDAALWRKMCKLWFKCKNVVKCNADSKFIEPLSKYHAADYITCTDTSGDLLAIGTAEGYIYFYDICNLHKGSTSVIYDREYLQNVQLLRNDTNVICISCSMNGHVHFWDLNTNKLIDQTRGRLICASYSYCYVSKHNVIVVEGSIPKTVYEFGPDRIIAIGADNDKVHFYTEGGHYNHLNTSLTKDNYTFTCVRIPNIRIRNYYVFKPDIAVCITEYGYLGFLAKGTEWKLHNLFPILHAVPTAVLIYAHLLILGLDSGNVHIFYVKDFETIDFDTITSKKLSLDTTAVMSLNVIFHIEEYLLVSYKKKIYVVKFT
ncbi:uncharacterized protein LOC143177183 [Calliopsis andreniformis]|uniref:uncharacterized protein LOC143177183 n=1 Tax=Calliopsis andreniformis TaxID=337506 RepID=UPI003FCC33D5